MRKYLNTWLQLTNCAFSSTLSNRIDSAGYFAGKLVRFVFFWLLIVSIFRFTDTLVGYSKYEVLLFFLTFNFIDVFSQAFFRGMYLFQSDVRRGNFDFILTKPINSLFYSLSRLNDLLDIIFLVPITALLVYVMAQLNITVGALGAYALFFAFGMVVVLAIHILAAAITMWSYESENFIWLYRYTMATGQFPSDIFSPRVQTLFTYVMPIMVIVAFPSKALLGRADSAMFVTALLVSTVFFGASMLLWRAGLRRYSSASS